MSAGAATVVVLRDGAESTRCTLIGSFAGVQVVAKEQESGQLTRATTCVAARCRALRPSLGGSRVEVWQRGIRLRAHGPVVTSVVLVLERRGRKAEVVSRRTRLRPIEINGPGCGTDWAAGLIYRGGRLVSYRVRGEVARPS